MINTRMSASPRALSPATTYHEDPTTVLASKLVAPSCRKKGVMGWVASSTTSGSSALANSLSLAGPSSPMVAYVSSTMSGYSAMNAAPNPLADHDKFHSLLKTPAGALTVMGASSNPYTALTRSNASGKLTCKRYVVMLG